MRLSTAAYGGSSSSLDAQLRREIDENSHLEPGDLLRHHILSHCRRPATNAFIDSLVFPCYWNFLASRVLEQCSIELIA